MRHVSPYQQSSPTAPVHTPLALTWPQHPDLQQVGGPVGQPGPAAVVVLPPELSHALVLAGLGVAGPADAQAHVVAGLCLLDGRACPEPRGSVPPLHAPVAGERHQVVELGAAGGLESPRHRHRHPRRVVGLDDALQVEGLVVGHPWSAGDGCDSKPGLCGETGEERALRDPCLSRPCCQRAKGRVWSSSDQPLELCRLLICYGQVRGKAEAKTHKW